MSVHLKHSIVIFSLIGLALALICLTLTSAPAAMAAEVGRYHNWSVYQSKTGQSCRVLTFSISSITSDSAAASETTGKVSDSAWLIVTPRPGATPQIHIRLPQPADPRAPLAIMAGRKVLRVSVRGDSKMLTPTVKEQAALWQALQTQTRLRLQGLRRYGGNHDFRFELEGLDDALTALHAVCAKPATTAITSSKAAVPHRPLPGNATGLILPTDHPLDLMVKWREDDEKTTPVETGTPTDTSTNMPENTSTDMPVNPDQAVTRQRRAGTFTRH